MNLFTSPPSPINQYYSHIITFTYPVPYRFLIPHVDAFLAESVSRMNSFDHNGYDRGISFVHPECQPTKSVKIDYWLQSISWFPEVPHRTDVPWFTSVRPVFCNGPKDRPYIPRGIWDGLLESDREDAEACMEHHKFTSKAGVCRLPGSGRPLGAKDKKPRRRRA